MVKVTVSPVPLTAGVKLYAWPTVTLFLGAPESASCVLLFEVCTGVVADVDVGIKAVDPDVPVEPPPPQPASAPNMSAAQQAVRIDTARMT